MFSLHGPLTLHAGVLIAAPVGVALLIDRLWGEPAVRWHPVVWMGAYLGWAGQRLAPLMGDPSPPRLKVFARGALAWLLGAALVVVVALGVVALLSDAPIWLQALGLGVLLKPLLAWRMLADEVRAVEQALSAGLQAGRDRLAWLVSRDVNRLDEAQVRAGVERCRQSCAYFGLCGGGAGSNKCGNGFHRGSLQYALDLGEIRVDTDMSRAL